MSLFTIALLLIALDVNQATTQRFLTYLSACTRMYCDVQHAKSVQEASTAYQELQARSDALEQDKHALAADCTRYSATHCMLTHHTLHVTAKPMLNVQACVVEVHMLQAGSVCLSVSY